MTAFTLDDAKRAWARSYEGLGQEEIDQRVLGFAALVRGIAQQGAVSPEEFAAELRIDLLRAVELFDRLATVGVQVDEAGHVVGAALTARETPHRIEVGGVALYAWCALDTLFISGLLSERAEVASSCPVTGESVRVTVTPEGVESHSPAGAVLSVVIPGAGTSSAQTGPASPT
ncbi:MAG: organomercurial lyase [Proteobacteria bacterium]|nr:organomercurial lyase [Pseudomonadota bacterium]